MVLPELGKPNRVEINHPRAAQHLKQSKAAQKIQINTM
jgi:hypothetical protein